MRFSRSSITVQLGRIKVALKLPPAALIVTVILAMLFLPFTLATSPPKAERFSAMAVEILDGDTLKVRRGDRLDTIRLIGLDAPEIHENERARRQMKRTHRDLATILELGAASKAFLASHLRRGTPVQVELGDTQRDRYGRMLAYVYDADGTMLNELILREGYAYLLTYDDNLRYVDRLRNAARLARENKRGLFGAPTRQPRR